MTDDREARSERDSEILDDALVEYFDRLNAGEILHEDEIVAKHAEQAAAILEHLRLFQNVTGGGETNEPLGTLGGYTLRRQIGRGGMGTVYDAWQNAMDRRVALKVLPRALAVDTRAATRFIREAQIAGKLDHPNVVHVHGTGVEEQVLYYTMEFVEGETLSQLLSRIKDAEPETETPFGQKSEQQFYLNLAKAFADVADGLQHAHSKGVIHRDVKPSNLILDSEGRLRILDFGLARLEGQESLTISGDLVGTPLYMSPEQARQKRIQVDHRTDVYSLGATMYEALCGRPPFRGKDHADTLSQIIEREPVAARRVNPRVPADVETIVLKCLRKDPQDRYGTAEALGQDLRRFVRGDPVEARPESGWERLATRLRRHRTKVMVVAAFLTLSLAVAWFALQKKHADDLREQAYDRQKEEAYMPAVLGVLKTLLAGEFSLRVVAGQSESLFDFTEASLTPVTVEDFAALRRAHGSHAIGAAIEELETVAEVRPRMPDAHYHLAKAYALLDHPEEARRELRQALECDPDFVPARVLQLKVVGLDGTSPEFDTVWQEYGETGDWRSWWIEAERSAREKRWPDAVTAYGKLIALWEDGREPYIGSAIEAHIGQGVACLATGNYLRAQKDFGAACTLAPEFVEGALLLGKTYYLLGRAEHVDAWKREAEDIFERLHAGASAEEEDEVALWITAVYDSLKDYSMGLEWRTGWERPLPLNGCERIFTTDVAIWMKRSIWAGRQSRAAQRTSLPTWFWHRRLVVFCGGKAVRRGSGRSPSSSASRSEPWSSDRRIGLLEAFWPWQRNKGTMRPTAF